MGVERTERFKEHIQAMLRQEFGVKVSKAESWEFFKNFVDGIVEFTLEAEDNEVPLAGTGKFEILKTKPRGSKKEEGWPFTPRFRFRPSVTINRRVEDYFDLGGHDIEVGHFGLFKEETEDESEPVAVESETEDIEEGEKEAPISRPRKKEPEEAPEDTDFSDDEITEDDLEEEFDVDLDDLEDLDV